MYLLYNLAIWLACPLLFLWIGSRKLAGRMPGLAERLGLLGESRPKGTGPVAWFHAVSLGETKLAACLARELRSRVPGLQVVLTSSTRTGWEEARRSAAPGDIVLYPPLDYAWICRRFLRKLQPDVVVVLETELWPNLFRETKRAGAGLLLVNGRISDRSIARYRATRFFWRRVLAYPDAYYVQSERDAERFRAIGAPAGRIQVGGNLKFAVRPAASPLVDALRTAIRDSGVSPVLVAGSTMAGEERFLLETFAALRPEFPALWMILAPRHTERFAAVAAETRSSGIPLQLRSEWRPGQPIAPGIFLLDSTGELAALYQLASAAFIGGTLVPTGGHNILEPAQFGCPTVIGPSMENFEEIAREFLNASGAGPIPGAERIRSGAVIQVQNAAGLATALGYLFRNPDYARHTGRAAHDVAARQSSGLAPLLAELERHLGVSSSAALAPAAISEPAPAAAGRWK